MDTVDNKRPADNVAKTSSQSNNEATMLLTTSVSLYNYNRFWFFEPMITIDLIEQIRNLAVRPDDVLVSSFTKSGTTWTQEIVWQVLTRAGVPLVNADSNMEHRFPMLEFRAPNITAPTLDEITKRPSPRLMKSHMPYNCIPEGFTRGLGKVIYIAREPKDVCVSLYHFYRMIEAIQFRGTFEQLIDGFIKGEVVFGPWIDHVTGFWRQGNNDNLLLLTYEQLQQDGLSTVRKIANFLGVSLTEDQLATVHQKCSFQSMKDNPQTNYDWWEKGGYTNKQESTFMRKGVIGDWVNYFTPETAAKFDRLFEERLRQLGLTFKS